MSTNYNKLLVKQLKDLLRERGLKVSGRKAELIQRLEEYDRSHGIEVSAEVEVVSPDTGISIPTFLPPITPSPISTLPSPTQITPAKVIPTPATQMISVTDIDIKPILASPVPQTVVETEVSEGPPPEFVQITSPTMLGPTMLGPSVVGDIEGLEELLTELPAVSFPNAPKKPMNIITPSEIVQSQLPSAKVLPTVLAPSAIKLPSQLPSQVKPQAAISLPEISSFKTPPIAKIGRGGLPLQTDLSTLASARKASTTANMINPQAVYQNMVVADSLLVAQSPPVISLAPLPATSLPQIAAEPATAAQITAPLETQPVLVPLTSVPTVKTSPLPLTTTPQASAIRIPTMKVTAPKPTGISLPTTKSAIAPLPLAAPSIFIGASATETEQTKPVTPTVAIAYTPEQDLIRNISNIDVSRLKTGRTKKGDGSYSVAELKAIAGSINLPKSGNKDQLVQRISEAVKRINPNAFDK